MRVVERLSKLSVVIFLTVMCAGISRAQEQQPQMPPWTVDASRKAIEDHLTSLMRQGGIPGIAASVTTRDTTMQFYLGTTDVTSKRPVTERTVFEIGSNSKAFTGLAIQLLVTRGLLDLEKPIRHYLPWFDLAHAGRELSVRDFLYHTSGLTFATIKFVRNHDKPGPEPILRDLNKTRTSFPPGTTFSYATVNYTILASLIETVTRRTYADFVRSEILVPLGLEEVWIADGGAPPTQKSRGHKLSWGRAVVFDAPIYSGHAAAGYLHAPLPVLTRWSMLVAGRLKPEKPSLQSALDATLRPDRTVAPSPIYGSFYGSGWFEFTSWGRELYHAGANPTFSSCIDVMPEKGVSVVVLANLNSNLVAESCRSIIFYLHTGEFGYSSDPLETIDRVGMGLSAIALVVIVGLLLAIAYRLHNIRREGRHATSRFLALRWFNLAVGLILATAAALAIPTLIFYQLPWRILLEWGPGSLAPSVALLWGAITLALLYHHLGAWQKPKLPLQGAS